MSGTPPDADLSDDDYGVASRSSDFSSSDAVPLTEEELAERRCDGKNVRLLLKSKWSRRLKATPRIRIWNLTTGGRTGRNDIVDTARSAAS